METSSVVFTQPGVAQLQKRELSAPAGDQVLVKTEYTVVSGGTERAYLLGMPNTRQVFPTGIGYCGIGRVVEYPRAMEKIYTSAVEVNGFGRRQLMVSGSKGTVDIVPLERPCRMTWSDRQLATQVHDDRKVEIPVEDLPRESRYDEEFRCFHDYVTGAKKGPWSYEHNYLVQEVLIQIVGGCYGKNTD